RGRLHGRLRPRRLGRRRDGRGLGHRRRGGQGEHARRRLHALHRLLPLAKRLSAHRLEMIFALFLALLTPVKAAELPRVFLPLPLVTQTTHYDCGPASLYSVLVFWDAYNGDETSLFPLLDT